MWWQKWMFSGLPYLHCSSLLYRYLVLSTNWFNSFPKRSVCWNADSGVHCVLNMGCGVIRHYTLFWALVAFKWPPEANSDDSRIASCHGELKQLFLSLNFSLWLLSSMQTDKMGNYLLCLQLEPATVPVSKMKGGFQFCLLWLQPLFGIYTFLFIEKCLYFLSP